MPESLKENAQQSTNNWLKVWRSWDKPEALSKILEDFYATVHQKGGHSYEPDSLRVMITAIDRYLTGQGYKHSIITDREFKSSNQVLEGKARLLQRQGKGKRPNKSRRLTNAEVNEHV